MMVSSVTGLQYTEIHLCLHLFCCTALEPPLSLGKNTVLMD